MKKARMNISHSRFILFKLKIFGEIVTTIVLLHIKWTSNYLITEIIIYIDIGNTKMH